MDWYNVLVFCGLVTLGLLGIGVAVAGVAATVTELKKMLKEGTVKKVAEAFNWIIEFYLSLIAYFVLHLLIVTSSDFVDAFNIPPLNIGIYVDKLAAIRALLMVVADLLEWGFLDKVAHGSGSMQQPMLTVPNNPRRIGSIVSFLGMLICRIVYLYLIYKSDNKSLSVFIVLCIEGFWFGVFQMSFFAIGPQYNAVTSFGIHTMGNFIFFTQLILQHRAKTKPYINCLYRVRVHGWICLMTSISAFIVWLGFCVGASGDDGMGGLASKWKGRLPKVQSAIGPEASDLAEKEPNADGTQGTAELDRTGTPVGISEVWSPLLLFIVGAFAEDFSVPGILPFAFLDTDKAALVNYLTPLFFMSGALVTVLLNDVFTGTDGQTYHVLKVQGARKNWEIKENIKISAMSIGPDWQFKEWSAGKALGWHGLWLLNVPKYMAFMLAMWCIHGTFGRLRCIVQSRWRVMLLTMFVVIPRAFLETAGYVGVANYAIAKAAISSYYVNGSASGNVTKKTNFGKMDFDGFQFIVYHDIIAMFCRFVYGKLAIRYNTTPRSIN